MQPYFLSLLLVLLTIYTIYMLKKKMTGREVLEEALRRCCSTYCDQYPRYEGEFDSLDLTCKNFIIKFRQNLKIK